MGKLSRLPQRSNSGDGGGDLDARVARLESNVANIAEDIREIKGDLRSLWYAGLIAVALLLGTLATGYIRLSDQSNSIETSVVRLQEQNRQILQRLDQLGKR